WTRREGCSSAEGRAAGRIGRRTRRRGAARRGGGSGSWRLGNCSTKRRRGDATVAGTRKTPRIGTVRWHRERLLSKRGDLCCFCGLIMQKPTLEHVHPRSHGGRTVMSNLSLSHSTCNRERGCRPFWEWRERQMRKHQRLLPAEPHIRPEYPRPKRSLF